MKDMTKGAPLKLILNFSIPLFFSGVVQNLYNLCDTIMVGRMVGVEALAAIGATLPVFFLLVIVGSFFTFGVSLLTAQFFGKKDYNKMRASVATSIVLTLFVGVIYHAFMALSLRWMLKLSNVPDNIIDLTYSYLIVLCIGGISLLFFNLFICFLRAIGNSKGPLYFLIFSSFINIFFNYVFIKWLGMGIAGSAYGTVVAGLLGAIVSVLYIYKKYPLLVPQKQDWHTSRVFVKKHLNIAIPMAVQGVFISVSLFVFQVGCNSLGYEVMAAVAAANRIENIATVALYSLGMAVATYVAQNYGRYRIARIRRGVYQASMCSVGIAFFMGAVVYLFADNLIALFVTKEDLLILPNVSNLAKEYLHITVFYFLFLGHIFVYRNVLQGLGNTTIPMLSSFVELLARVFVIFGLAKTMGFKAVAHTQPVAWALGAIVLYVGYYFEVKKLRSKIKEKLKKISLSQ